MHALGEPRPRPITVISEMNRIESIQPVQNEIGISGAQAMPEPMMAKLSRFAVAQHLSGRPEGSRLGNIPSHTLSRLE
jgi:hypothetical protein